MKYIWLKESKNSSYAEFKTCFNYSGEKEPILKITADFKFAVYVNGEFFANGQYADLPEYKTFSAFDLSSFLKDGENELLIKAYHSGEDFQTCRSMPASVAFTVTAGEKTLAESDENALARESAEYSKGDLCTPQLGFMYNYSFTAREKEWEKATVVDTNFKEYAKPIKNTYLSAPRKGKVIAQGEYKLNGGKTAGEITERAYLSQRFYSELTGMGKDFKNKHYLPMSFKAENITGDGVYLVLDVGFECAGYPYFSIEVPEETVIYFGWGEHLSDLRPRTSVGVRNFAFKAELKAGKNDFSDYLRRIGARYFIIFVAAKKFKINDAGIREELYPFDKPKKDFGDKLYNAVYETARRTLELCAHEHYEDCPWREQALYGMDSRNQMLFGYGAFKEYEYPRAAMLLMSKCVEEDGLLSLSPPARMEITIPSFSLYYVIAVCENAERDYNTAFVTAVLPAVKRIMGAFTSAAGKNGALYTLEDVRYWNFHEWSFGLDGGTIFRKEKIKPEGDCILTALALIAAEKLSALLKRAGENESAAEMTAFAEKLFTGLKTFYDEERGVFASYSDSGNLKGYHEYAQATALLASRGRFGKKITEKLVSTLYNPEGLVELTLAGLPVKYEALLKYGGKGAKKYVLEDCMGIFGKMLLSGATSFWETGYGDEDFDDAGSLCHGWSSVACYVLDTLFLQK